MSIGDVRRELYTIAEQYSRGEIPYFEAAGADYNDMRESAQSATSNLDVAGQTSNAAANEVIDAAGHAAVVQDILKEARIKLGGVTLALTEARDHNSTIAGNVSQAAAATQAAVQHVDSMHANVSKGHELAYGATAEYARVMSAEDREPVPTALAHTNTVSEAVDSVGRHRQTAEEATAAVARLAGPPDKLASWHAARLTEAEHIGNEIDRLLLQLDALTASLSELNSKHGSYEGMLKGAYDQLKRFGRSVMGGDFKDLAEGAEQVAKTAEQVGDQITGQ